VVSLVIGFLATIPGSTRERYRQVDISTEISGRHDFAVRGPPVFAKAPGGRLSRRSFSEGGSASLV
jgi:hypothetical protein